MNEKNSISRLFFTFSYVFYVYLKKINNVNAYFIFSLIISIENKMIKTVKYLPIINYLHTDVVLVCCLSRHFRFVRPEYKSFT